jgi:hypothetical protein
MKIELSEKEIIAAFAAVVSVLEQVPEEELASNDKDKSIESLLQAQETLLKIVAKIVAGSWADRAKTGIVVG